MRFAWWWATTGRLQAWALRVSILTNAQHTAWDTPSTGRFSRPTVKRPWRATAQATTGKWAGDSCAPPLGEATSAAPTPSVWPLRRTPRVVSPPDDALAKAPSPEAQCQTEPLAVTPTPLAFTSAKLLLSIGTGCQRRDTQASSGDGLPRREEPRLFWLLPAAGPLRTTAETTTSGLPGGVSSSLPVTPPPGAV